jgi:phage-related protein
MTTSNEFMVRDTRPIAWISGALRDFGKFPEEARTICLGALTVAAEGGKADISKPMHGFGSGVLEIALPYRGNAFRVVYALQFAEKIWVIHAFQKKSSTGIKTPKRELEVLKARLKWIREQSGEK